MPAKKKSEKVVPIDPELKARFLQTIQTYTSNKGHVLPRHSEFQDAAESVPKVMKAQSKMLKDYERGLIPPTRHTIVALMKKTIKDYPTPALPETPKEQIQIKAVVIPDIPGLKEMEPRPPTPTKPSWAK